MTDTLVLPATDADNNYHGPKMSARHVDVFYGETHAIKDVSIDIDMDNVTAFIGPSGCGKSTFLRTMNRMNDTIPTAKVTGDILLDGEDVYDNHMDVVQLRARVGMVFQKPNPFPKSIFENVAYGPRIHGLAHTKAEMAEIVESALRRAGLDYWTKLDVREHASWADFVERELSVAAAKAGARAGDCVAAVLPGFSNVEPVFGDGRLGSSRGMGGEI